ncbi:MAG: hypothetical protein ACE5DM_00295 [Candidatus Nanoarchaeia archaeon]
MMGIFARLQLLDVKKGLKDCLEQTLRVLDDEKELKSRLDSLTGDARENEFTQFLANLAKAEEIDLRILKGLRKKSDEKYKKAKEMLKILHTLAKESDHHRINKLLNYLKEIIEHLEITDQLEAKEEQQIIYEFESLTRTRYFDNQDIDDFFAGHTNFFKLKHNKRLKKNISKFFNNRLEEELEQGPTIKRKELQIIKRGLSSFLRSLEFKRLLVKSFSGKTTARIDLYGSLVTGFSSNQSKFRGLPSDHGRISDVDLGITLDPKVMQELPLGGNHLYKKGHYYGPYTESKAQDMGPFSQIFKYIRKSPFAGRTDRKIGIIIVDTDFYDHNLSKDPHIAVVKQEVDTI